MSFAESPCGGHKELDVLHHVLAALTATLERRQQELQGKRVAFHATLADVQALSAMQDCCLYLDVGGIKHHTSSQVFSLASADERIIPILFQREPQWEQEDGGYTFFDCDSAWFGSVLTYLRQGSGQVPLPTRKPSPTASAVSPKPLGHRTPGWDRMLQRSQHESLIMVSGSDETDLKAPAEFNQVWTIGERRLGTKWVKLPPMLRPRLGAAATLWDGHLVVTGGFDGSEYTATAEEFDPKTNSWSWLPPMLNARGDHAAAVVNERLVVVGGACGSGFSKEVEEFDPAARCWRSLPGLPSGRAHCAACALDGRLLVIGGENDAGNPLGLVEEFVPSTGDWRRLPSQLRRRSSCLVTVARGRVVVQGGFDDEGQEVPGAEELDPKYWRWTLEKESDLLPRDEALFTLESHVLLHTDGADNMEVTETLRLGAEGAAGSLAARSYAMCETLTVPGPRGPERSASSVAVEAIAPTKAKKHRPVTEGRPPHNRILLSR